jgi:hypothetical protein
LADALVELLGAPRGAPGDPDPGPTTTVMVRVDAAALRRGSAERGEICEIDGVGPVSVEVARRLLGDAYVTVLVHDGRDVLSITGQKRTLSTRLRAAVVERDRHCVWPGCDATVGLQIHHFVTDVGDGGVTRADEICRICTAHHDLCTYGGWRIERRDGVWATVAPEPLVSRS